MLGIWIWFWSLLIRWIQIRNRGTSTIFTVSKYTTVKKKKKKTERWAALGTNRMCVNYVLYLDDRNEVPPVLAEDVLTGLQAPHHLLILSFLFILYQLLQTALSNGQITRRTPNPKCRLLWCLIEFIDWRYSQSCRPLLWTSTPLPSLQFTPLPPVWISTGLYSV